MTDTDRRTEPALTAEEWQLAADGGMCACCYAANYRIVRTVDDDETPVPLAEVVYPKDVSRHALAALCLHGQPFGFTHDDVRGLRQLAQVEQFRARTIPEKAIFPEGERIQHQNAADWFNRLADRIESLLPPR